MAVTTVTDAAPGDFKAMTLDANIDADGNTDAFPVSDLTNVTIVVTEEVNDGTITIQPQYSHDGSAWVALGAGEDADAAFPWSQPLETGNGMSITTGYVRVAFSNHSATGEYNVVVGGQKRR